MPNMAHAEWRGCGALAAQPNLNRLRNLRNVAMSQNAPNEQSMEDILASIRRIISDDTPSGEASGTARDAHAERSNLPGSEPRGPEFAMPNGGPDGRHGPMAAQNVPASSRPEPIAPPTTGEDPLADLIGEPRNGPPPGAPALGQAAQTQPQTQQQVPTSPPRAL